MRFDVLETLAIGGGALGRKDEIVLAPKQSAPEVDTPGRRPGIGHLGHFQLVMRLLPALQRAQGARVVSVSARPHSRAPIVFEDRCLSAESIRRGWPMASSKTPTFCLPWRSTRGLGRMECVRFFASGHDHRTSIEAYLPPLEPEARNCWDYPHGDGRGLHDPQHRNQEPG